MNYSFQNFTFDELKEFLTLIPEQILYKPIKKNEKEYSKDIKGFRANKLPKSKLVKVYYNEIHLTHNTALEKFLIEIVKENFANTKIEKIVDNSSERPIIEVAFEIEREILEVGLTISPKHVFMISGYKLSITEATMLDMYHKFIIEKLKIENDKIENELNKNHKDEYDKLNILYTNTCKDLNVERAKIKELIKINNNKDFIINSLEHEIMNLNEYILKNLKELEHYKNKINDYEEVCNRVNNLKIEIESLNKTIEQLELNIACLEDKVLSPNKVKDMCNEVLEDLQQKNIYEDDFIARAREFFSDEDSLEESWIKISSETLQKIEMIVQKMNEENIHNKDIELLDDIENEIYYSFMIIKGLKVIFYRYLEQGVSKKTIEDKFIKK